MKYTATEILTRAKSLADLENSNFLSWGDQVYALNLAYKKVYTDCIASGDLNYLQEVVLESKGSAEFALPEDFYQLASISDINGNELPKLPLSSSPIDYGYLIVNGTIRIQGCPRSVIMRYYPEPVYITYRQPRTSSFELSPNGLITGFGNLVAGTNGIFDITTRQQVNSLTLSSTDIKVLGRDQYVVGGSLRWIIGDSTYGSSNYPCLKTSGSIIDNSIGGTGQQMAWSNDDSTAVFHYMSGTGLHFNRQPLNILLSDDQLHNGRVIYWNNKWALVTLRQIIYEDGTKEKSDVSGAVALLKCDTSTGYGYLVRTAFNQFAVEGWAPETLLDYPSNILFELTAILMAIQFRSKQSANTTFLEELYSKHLATYWKSLPSDNNQFQTIRNINNRRIY